MGRLGPIGGTSILRPVLDPCTILRGVLEIADALADPAADLRQTVGPEDQDDDEKDDDELGDPEMGNHGGSLFSRESGEFYH